MFNHITPDLLTQISKNSTSELNNKYSDNKQDNFLISQNYTDFEYTNTSNCEYTNFTDLKKKHCSDPAEMYLLHTNIVSLKKHISKL